MTETNDDDRRLTSRDGRFILLCVVAILLFGAVIYVLFPKAFPEASIEFKAGRGEARQIAEQYLAARGIRIEGDRFAGLFDADEEQKVYLERTLGLEEANRLYAGDARLWRWQLRWFRPLRKSEVRVAVTPAGEVVGFRREIDEDAPGARLEPDRARAIAESFLASSTRFRPDSLRFVEASASDRAARRDHSFVWEMPSWNVGASTFRVQVDVLGDSVGVFRQYVKVPEAWSRDYANLRSRNETAGAVATFFYALTGIGALFLVVRFTRLSDVPWKTIGAFAGVGAVLTFLNGLNSVPLALFEYDTTEAFSAFLGNVVIGAFVVAILSGVWIGLFGAAGEPLYRRRLPTQQALARTFTGKGFRSKRVFLGLILGYALTAFFMAYQAVFFLVSAKLGAWAPAEIPYSNLLNTYFPWIAVLLIGFLPAVSEEFSNRMFSIPFYERLVKNPVLAVILAGFVWGFLHSAYPNQPFYIRGLEVGLAGVVMGFMMLRFGIFPLLVWHFTVDAVYTSLLLLRSGNLYFVLSGAICAGILLVPLVVAFVLYRKHKSFEPDQDLTNAAAGFVPEADDAGEGTPADVVAVPHRPVPVSLVIASVVAILVAAAFLYLPTNYPPRDVNYPMSRSEATALAREFLVSHGADPDSFQSVTVPDGGFDSFDPERDNLPPWSTDPVATRYVSETGGLSAWDRLVRTRIPASLWTTRFVRPLVKDEWHVSIDPRERRVAAWLHQIADEKPGADLEEGAARSIVESQMAGESWRAVAATSHKQDKRRDWTFVYADSGAAVGQAVPRLTLELHGDVPAGSGVTLHVPETYVRNRTRSTALTTLLLVIRVLTFGTLIGLIVAALVTYIRREPVPWRRLFRITLFLAAPVVLSQVNKLPALLEAYNSEIPWNVFLVTGVVGLTLGAVVQALMILAALLVFEAARPGWGSELRPAAWPAQARHAVLVALLALAIGVTVDRLELLARIQWPALFPGPSPPTLAGYDTFVPFFDVAWSAIVGAFLVAALVGGIDIVLNGPLKKPALRWLMAVLVAVSLGPDHVMSAAEAVVPTLFEVLALAAAVIVIVRAVRGNVLAYFAVLPPALGGQEALALATQPQNDARIQGIATLVILLLPLLLVSASALRGRRPA